MATLSVLYWVVTIVGGITLIRWMFPRIAPEEEEERGREYIRSELTKDRSQACIDRLWEEAESDSMFDPSFFNWGMCSELLDQNLEAS